MTQCFLAHPLGSAFKSRLIVLDAENVPVRAVLDVMKDAVLLSLSVLTAVGLKFLGDTEGQSFNETRIQLLERKCHDGDIFWPHVVWLHLMKISYMMKDQTLITRSARLPPVQSLFHQIHEER